MHGAIIEIFVTHYDENNEPNVLLEKYYMDHLCDNESKQDRYAVASVLEMILIEVKKLWPSIKTATLQSDNASCYQNSTLTLLILFLSYTHGIDIAKFIHTKTQDGKSVLDAHLRDARAMQIIIAYCKR